ncbi:MAG: DNA cytosine methyltransferase [Candidatus Omnitrophica bacterium]|nr:DNA cytosine methyltransferase [Candidatus Omnitrophota bacterium]
MDSIELFAGGGGLALGLHAAGFSPVAIVERDADSCRTLRENWLGRMGANPHLFDTDIRKVDFHEWEGRVQLVSGGPPCQPFSIGGKHRGYHDERDMFPNAVRVVRAVRPEAFIFENVRGLLRKSFAKYFGYVLLQLEYPDLTRGGDEAWTEHLSRLEEHHTGGIERGLRYRVVFQRVNAADFGVPQLRERVVIVGFRWDIQERWSFPRATHSQDALEVAKWLTGVYWDEHRIPCSQRPAPPPRVEHRLGEIETLPFSARWRTVRDALAGLPDPRCNEASRIANHSFQPGARKYPGHTGSGLDSPAKTLKAGGHGVPGGENMVSFPDGSVRYFTVRESARLQTFPDWYVFPSSWTESMRQIGNAVPVTLATVLGASVAMTLVEHRRRAARIPDGRPQAF